MKKFREVLHHHISMLEACDVQTKLFTSTETDKESSNVTPLEKFLHVTKVQEASQAKLYFPTKVLSQGMSGSV